MWDGHTRCLCMYTHAKHVHTIRTPSFTLHTHTHTHTHTQQVAGQNSLSCPMRPSSHCNTTHLPIQTPMSSLHVEQSWCTCLPRHRNSQDMHKNKSWRYVWGGGGVEKKVHVCVQREKGACVCTEREGCMCVYRECRGHVFVERGVLVVVVCSMGVCMDIPRKCTSPNTHPHRKHKQW